MFCFFCNSQSKGLEKFKSIHDFKAKMINGEIMDFSSFKGKKLLIVNTASYCGLTKQYQDLESLYNEYKEKGFEIIAFPSNDFANQEPGTNDEIKFFCDSKYTISFELMSKINVTGKNIHPIYERLTKKELNGKYNSTVRWNFQKYLIDEEGRLVTFLYPFRSPKSKKIINWLKN